MAALMRSVLAIVLLASTLAWAQSDSRAPENEIKAAFLYKFGSFVEWPAETFAGPDGGFVIGVMGADAVAAELERITAGRTIQERAVTVRRVRRGEPLGRLQILFIGDTESARLAEIAAATRGRPVLLVTESENSISRGSMINFVEIENKVRFDVAPAPAERDQLKISARLLSVARKVVPRS
jgi:hypothetical protein